MTITANIVPTPKPPKEMKVPFLVEHSMAGCIVLVTVIRPHYYEGTVVAQTRKDGHNVGYVSSMFDKRFCKQFDGKITLQNEEE